VERKKDLAYYLALDYDIIIRKLQADGETFFQAFTKELDPIAFYGTGDSPLEAIDSFNETKRVLFEDHLENDIPIPEPEREEEAFYSGKFVVRTSPVLHRRLINFAKKDGRSLNSYINAVLEKFSTTEDIVEVFKNAMQTSMSLFSAGVARDVYRYEGVYFKAVEQKKADAA
jgi:predicted HicB family RNase H-like nuclease